MDWLAAARTAANNLRFVDRDGGLVRLGSLELLDYATELEEITNLTIPGALIVPGAFDTFATVAALLQRIHEAASRTA